MTEAGDAAGEAAAAVERALRAAEAAAEAAAKALGNAEHGIETADDARAAMTAVEESATAITEASSALVAALVGDHRLRRHDHARSPSRRTCWR